MANKRKLIHVIDDDESMRRALELLFRSANFDVQVFCSAEEFIESASLGDGDCIILDMRMPGMTGLDLQRELAYRKIRIPVIAVSACDDKSTRDLARAFGAAAFLGKPVDDQALINVIEWAVGE
jgi:FixJ family two-component response regulator